MTLPPGTYTIVEIHRHEEYWHVPEMSDGYTYRLFTIVDGRKVRVSIWQNDLVEAIHGPAEEDA